MLRQVAYFMQANTQGLTGNSITAPDLKRILSEYLATLSTTQDLNSEDIANVLIHQLRTRNFILCFLGAEYYAFVHRTFLEYFCAWEFVWQFEKARTIDIDGLKEVFGAHWQDESWHEVLRLITGMIDSKFAGEIIEFLINIEEEFDRYDNLLIAAKCLSEVRNRTAIQKIDNILFSVLKVLFIDNSKTEKGYEILHIIAHVWSNEKDAFDWIKKQAIYNRTISGRVDAIRVMSEVFNTIDILNFLKYRILNDKSKAVKKVALETLFSKCKSKYEILEILLKVAKQDKDSSFIILAASYFVDFQNNKFLFFKIIKNCIDFNPFYKVVKSVIKELTKNWKEEAKTFEILRHSIITNNSYHVKIFAIKELVKNWKERPETYRLLKKTIRENNNHNVRKAAIIELSKGWKENPETYKIIRYSAIFDGNYYVKETAIDKLSGILKYSQEAFEITKQSILSDDDYDIRRKAIKKLAITWQDKKETFYIVKKVAVYDRSPRVRITAIEELAKGWKKSSEIFQILHNLAIKDTYMRRHIYETIPRQLALEIIVKQYKDYPEVIPLLLDRATNDPDEKIREFAQEQLEKLTN